MKSCDFGKPKPRSCAGFTFVELTLATALTMLMSVVLFSALSMVVGTFQRVEGRADTFREARAALHLIASEWSRAIDLKQIASDPDTLGSDFSTKIRANLGGQSSFAFLATLPQSAQGQNAASDICAIAYFFVPSEEGNALYRRMISSDETFERLQAGSPAVEPGDLDPALSEPIAQNVQGMDVAYLDANLNEVGDTALDPAYVEVRLRMINQRTADRTRGNSDAGEFLEEQSIQNFELRWKL